MCLQDSLHCRFGNTLNWYNGLKEVVQSFVDEVIERSHSVYVGIDTNLSSNATASTRHKWHCSSSPPDDAETASESSGIGSRHAQKRVKLKDICTPENLFPDPLARERTSEYLHVHCPICFGGKLEPSMLSPRYVVILWGWLGLISSQLSQHGSYQCMFPTEA